MTRLLDKVAIVTGSSKGIGFECAKILAEESAKIVMNARGEDDLEKSAEAIRAMGGRVATVAGDIGNRAVCERVLAAAKSEFGGLDILVNNAGIGRFVEVENMTDEDFDSVMRTNLYGVFYMCRGAVPMMEARGGGYIINISSLAGQNTFARGGAYCASKHALNGFSECLMLEVRQRNIAVSYVCPGSVETSFGHSSPSEDNSWRQSARDVAQVVRDLIIGTSARTLVSKVEMRPMKPKRS
ncbi:MAG: SDR family NAD(P)-dependent oxidoreductase [bacterium]